MLLLMQVSIFQSYTCHGIHEVTNDCQSCQGGKEQFGTNYLWIRVLISRIKQPLQVFTLHMAQHEDRAWDTFPFSAVDPSSHTVYQFHFSCSELNLLGCTWWMHMWWQCLISILTFVGMGRMKSFTLEIEDFKKSYWFSSVCFEKLIWFTWSSLHLPYTKGATFVLKYLKFSFLIFRVHFCWNDAFFCW